MKKYPLFKIHAKAPDIVVGINNVLASGFINEGEEVVKLTAALQKRFQTDKLSLLNSCTSALTLALKLSDVGHGDYVISTSMTCVATNTPIISLGANIEWADIDLATGMIDPKKVSIAIDDLRKEGKRVKAVIAVAWAGTPPDLKSLSDLCSNKGVKLILDAAHAFDATYFGRQLHQFVDFTCYSFQAIKHFTTGDGGALICNNMLHHKRAKALKWFGLDRDQAKDEKGDWKGQQWDVDIVEAGYKFNMNNLAAAIGLTQLTYIDELIAAHRSNARLYDELLDDVKCVVPLEKPGFAGSSHWVYTVRLTGELADQRDRILKALNDRGVMAGVVHVPNHTYTAFKSFMKPLPGVDKFSSTQFSLPCGWWLEPNDIKKIVEIIKEVL